mmetsp:Transcript_26105/g.75352  ORF Transcript_26105/g.75352 Transcript_26105/m.75352 type:complete len:259 (+) Transcript_26105:181-957(+)
MAVGVDEATDAMLPTGLPLADIGPAVRPTELALSGLSIADVAALVPTAVGPPHAALPGHLAVTPLALEHTPIGEDIFAFSVHGVVDELPNERGPVRRDEDPVAVLLAIPVVALEARAVVPHLEASAGLHVLLPFALVRGAVRVLELAPAVRLVVRPLAFVDVAIGMGKSPEAASTIVFELALVSSTVGPAQDTSAVPPPVAPLPGVDHTAAQVDGAPLDELALRNRLDGVVQLEPQRRARHGCQVLLLRLGDAADAAL